MSPHKAEDFIGKAEKAEFPIHFIQAIEEYAKKCDKTTEHVEPLDEISEELTEELSEELTEDFSKMSGDQLLTIHLYYRILGLDVSFIRDSKGTLISILEFTLPLKRSDFTVFLTNQELFGSSKIKIKLTKNLLDRVTIKHMTIQKIWNQLIVRSKLDRIPQKTNSKLDKVLSFVAWAKQIMGYINVEQVISEMRENETEFKKLMKNEKDEKDNEEK